MDSFGVWNGYPPFGLAKEPLFSDLWSKREPIADGTIEPGENVSFLLHLTGAPGIATAGPIEVTYLDESGDTGTWVSNVRYRIRWRCQSGFPRELRWFRAAGSPQPPGTPVDDHPVVEVRGAPATSLETPVD